MRLLVNGCSLEIAQMGPDFLLLQSPVNHPPSEVCVVLRVDQSESQWKVRLPEGISAASNRVRIATCT